MGKALAVMGWGAGLIAVAWAWAVLAPAQLLGSTSYLSTFGISMLPYLHAGDLVVVRPADEYRVGDVVAYRSQLLKNQIILHRIVAIDGVRYVMKGDNNSWLDEYRPVESDIVGREWFHAAGIGDFIARLRAPENSAVVFGIAGLLSVGAPSRISAKLLGRRRKKTDKKGGRPRAAGIGGGPTLTATAGVILGVAVLGLAASLAAMTYAQRQPLTSLHAVSVPYTQAGAYSWSGSAPTSATYPDGKFGTGDTVFLKLAHVVHFDYAYGVTSPAAVAAGGNGSMVAVVQSTVTGWKRTYVLQGNSEFTGSKASLAGDLDLASVLDLEQSYLRDVGLRSDDLTVTVTADIRVRGTVGGQAFSDQLAPQLPFHLDSTMLRFESTALPKAGTSGPGTISVGPAGTAVPAATGPEALLAPSQAGRVLRPATAVNRIGALGVSAATVDVRRWARAAATILAPAALLALALLVLALRGRDEPSRIQRRYGAKLVPVGTIAALRGETAVEVTSMASLVRLAEHHDRMILHEEMGGWHSYAIQDGDLFYFYRARSAEPRQAPPVAAVTA